VNRFDTSCGLTEKEIAIIRFNIKRELQARLPILPDNVETKLFFEGRDAWTYSWGLREQPKSTPPGRLYVDVTAKLKKEFHYLELPKRHRFLCRVQIGSSIYHPTISIQKEDA
jgi:hypothetical protein